MIILKILRIQFFNSSKDVVSARNLLKSLFLEIFQHYVHQFNEGCHCALVNKMPCKPHWIIFVMQNTINFFLFQYSSSKKCKSFSKMLTVFSKGTIFLLLAIKFFNQLRNCTFIYIRRSFIIPLKFLKFFIWNLIYYNRPLNVFFSRSIDSTISFQLITFSFDSKTIMKVIQTKVFKKKRGKPQMQAIIQWSFSDPNTLVFIPCQIKTIFDYIIDSGQRIFQYNRRWFNIQHTNEQYSEKPKYEGHKQDIMILD